jgi:hypothetical protein
MKFKKDKLKWKNFIEGKHASERSRDKNIRLSNADKMRIQREKEKRAEHEHKYYWKHKDLD